MRNLRRLLNAKNNLEFYFRLIFLLLGLVSFIVCACGQKLLLMPAFFCAFLYFFIIKPNLLSNVVGKIIIAIAFIRFCYVPVIYNFSNSFDRYSWYIPITINNELLVQLLLVIELFAIFFVIYLYFKKHPYNPVSHIENKHQKSFLAPLALVSGIVCIALIVLYPKTIPFISFGREPSNAIFSIFHVCLLVFFLYIFEIINSKIKYGWIKFIILLVSFAAFLIPTCIQLNSISRNLLLIHSLAFIFGLTYVFPKQKKAIYLSAFIALFIGFCFLTAMKVFTSKNVNPFISTISLYTNYSFCNAYFAGPTQYEIGIDLYNNGIFGLKYLFNDLFANLPFLSKYFFSENTVYLFNESIYHGVAQQDIIPLGIQSYIYFGPLLSWLLPALITYFALLCFDKSAHFAFRPSISYILACFSIVLALSQIISLNAISMLIVIKFAVPLLICVVDIVLVNKIFARLKHKTKLPLADNAGKADDTVQIQKSNKKTIVTNYIFSLAHQLALFLIPLITTPYISRTLLSDGVGQYDFAQSISYYFVMFASFGFSYYAQREIATKQKDKKARSKVFLEIMICKGALTLIALLLYFGLIFTDLFADYNNLLFVLSISIFATFLDISFLFKGMEDFKLVSIIQTIVKIATTALIFIFVKKSTDIVAYALILNIYSVLSCVLLFPFAKRIITFKGLGKLSIKKHIKPSFILFLPIIFGLFYTTFLRTMIGIIVTGDTVVIKDGVETVVKLSDIHNGYFSQADKLVQMGLSVVTALGSVMASRNSSLFSSGDETTFKRNIFNVTKFTLLLTIPLAIGIIFISNNFVPWFFGDSFSEVSNLLKYYPVLIIISGLGNVFGLQSLVSQGKYTKFTLGTFAGALAGIGFGIPLILFFKSAGAAITALIAESIVLFVFLLFF